MLKKPWTPGVTIFLQPHYQYVTERIYLPVQVTYNNWNIITFNIKYTSSE